MPNRKPWHFLETWAPLASNALARLMSGFGYEAINKQSLLSRMLATQFKTRGTLVAFEGEAGSGYLSSAVQKVPLHFAWNSIHCYGVLLMPNEIDGVKQVGASVWARVGFEPMDGGAVVYPTDEYTHIDNTASLTIIPVTGSLGEYYTSSGAGQWFLEVAGTTGNNAFAVAELAMVDGGVPLFF